MNPSDVGARAPPASANARQRASGVVSTPTKPQFRNPYLKTAPKRVTPTNPYKRSAVTSERNPPCASAKRVLDFTAEAMAYPSRKKTSAFPHHFAVSHERGSNIALSSSQIVTNLDNDYFDDIKVNPEKKYTLYFDGGSRGNPGIAGCGMALFDDDKEIWHGKEYIGDGKTNNEAEYTALLTGLNCARRIGVTRIHAKGDSELVVSQVFGRWHCRAKNLCRLLQNVLDAKATFSCFYISHVGRDDNRRADALANEAMDGRITDLGVIDSHKTCKREDKHILSWSISPSQIDECDLMVARVANPMQAKSSVSDAEAVKNAEAALCSMVSSQSIRDEEGDWTHELPFLVQFELERFNLRDRLGSGDFSDRMKMSFDTYKGSSAPCQTICEMISLIYEQEKILSKSPHEYFLKHCSNNGSRVDEADSCLCIFHAKLSETGIELLQPEPADLKTRRIHRRFGSHRFLDLHCDDSCTNSLASLKKYLNVHLKDNKVVLAGREYGFLHSCPPSKKVVFRLFAEKGVGIRKCDEITAPQAAARCIPASLNPNLSLTKYMKRMKLNFTTTVPTLVLKRGMLEVIEDIKADGHRETIMTDGAGLISREALNEVYSKYTHYLENRQCDLGKTNLIRRTTAQCPYSSFQMRIGGIKGMLVVDDSILGVKVQVRKSQIKYDVPLTKMAAPILDEKDDAMYHTIEVKEWDKSPPHAHLSVNIIQLLEARGVPREYFLSLARRVLDELRPVSDNYESLMVKYRASKFLLDTHSLFEDDLLMRMLHAQVPLDEPVMMHKVNQFINSELTTYREKSRYPIGESMYLRMLPDHTRLLESDEAFVALGDKAAQYEVERLGSVVAMRLPSYFSEDLRKLNIVSKADLLQRCPDKSSFFSGIVSGIILSTKGTRSEAEMMSGGDFDGDKLWCCWNETIVNSVKEGPGHHIEELSLADPFKQRLMAHTNPGWTNLITSYAMHHRNDKKVLGKLVKTLEMMRDKGFGAEELNKIATKAFLQVDDPHTAQWTASDEKIYGSLARPHWSTTFKNSSYQSTKVLGELFNMLGGARMREISFDDIEPEMNIHIRETIEWAEKKDSNEVEKIREDMRRRLKSFNQTVRDSINNFDLRDEVQRRWKDKTVSDMYKQHRLEIESLYDSRDLPMVFAILYAETYFSSRRRMTSWKGTPYVFAWKIGQDHITRLIADGEAKKNGHGIAPTIARGKYQLMFGKKR